MINFSGRKDYGTADREFFDIPEKKSGGSAPYMPNEANHQFRWRNCLSKIHPRDFFTDAKEAVEENAGVSHGTKAKEGTLRALVSFLFNDPKSPDLSFVQMTVWAVIVGALMGLYTLVWHYLIEKAIELVWETLPKCLFDWGIFTDSEGRLPLKHFFWMCPSLFSAILSFAFAELDIPTQNDWIKMIHRKGEVDFKHFLSLFILSTLGMASGLSLGPELPLLLTAGMIGSWISRQLKHNVTHTRIVALTAASAAIGSFFSFPMAGALFCLEVPHRYGLEYSEALPSAVIGSIVAVLTNRWMRQEEITGLFEYPALDHTLPSQVFTLALILGLYSAANGSIYVVITKAVKTFVCNFLRAPTNGYYELDDKGDIAHHEDAVDSATATSESSGNTQGDVEEGMAVEHSCSCWDMLGLCGVPERTVQSLREKMSIPHEGLRAAVAGGTAGALVGIIGMCFPHVMFWGEGQLQNLIDRGSSPLPIFGDSQDHTSHLVAQGFCLPDADSEGFGVGCSVLIGALKMLTVGLSLGTGIVGGHFWGPLFMGCSSAHVFNHLAKKAADAFGTGYFLSKFPSLVLLCVMGGTHVVVFRSYLGIMLIMLLTISKFGQGLALEGEYAAVFPLLVIAVFVALCLTGDVVFYEAQNHRGDLILQSEVLCRPGEEGSPLAVALGGDSVSSRSYLSADDANVEHENDAGISHRLSTRSVSSTSSYKVRTRGELKNYMPSLLMQSKMYSASISDSHDNLTSLDVESDSMIPPASAGANHAAADTEAPVNQSSDVLAFEGGFIDHHKMAVDSRNAYYLPYGP